MNDPERIDLDFLLTEPAAVYHAKRKDYLSSHALADFRHCPVLYHNKNIGLINDFDTTAYVVGRAAHTLILEGRGRYETEYAMGGPINPKTGNPYGAQTKAFAEWAASIGKPVLSSDQALLVEQMANSVREHEIASDLLQEGVAEGVIRRSCEGVDCQVRLDWLSPHRGVGIVDLKTCRSIDQFEDDFARYQYANQLAFYRAIVQFATGCLLPVRIIAVEKSEPFRTAAWLIDGQLLDAAQMQNRQTIRELRSCEKTNLWPTRTESVRRMCLITDHKENQ